MAQQVRHAAALTAELAAQSEKKTAAVCDQPPGLDELAEHRGAANMEAGGPHFQATMMQEESTASAAARPPIRHTSCGQSSSLDPERTETSRPWSTIVVSCARSGGCSLGRRDSRLLRQSHRQRQDPHTPATGRNEERGSSTKSRSLAITIVDKMITDTDRK